MFLCSFQHRSGNRAARLLVVAALVGSLASAQNGGSNQVDVLFAGDSDIDYWPDEKREALFPDSVNEGVAGWTCKELKNSINGFLEKHDPKWTVVVCGENDLASGRTVHRTFQRFQRIIERITNSGSRVLYISTKPEPSTTSLHPLYERYDQRIRLYANSLASGVKNPPLVMVDSYKGFEDLNNPISLYDEDQLHLSGKGYDYWGTWTYDAMFYANLNEPCTVWQSGECTQQKFKLEISTL